MDNPFGREEFPVPDRLGALEGWKILNKIPREEPALVSGGGYHVWKRGENAAYCPRDVLGHKPAEINCSCGFYAVRNPQDCFGYISGEYSVLVQIEGWGRCVVGDIGWRAEFARIRAIAVRNIEEVATLSLYAAAYECDLLISPYPAYYDPPRPPRGRQRPPRPVDWGPDAAHAIARSHRWVTALGWVEARSTYRCGWCGIGIPKKTRHLVQFMGRARYCEACGRQRAKVYESLYLRWHEQGKPKNWPFYTELRRLLKRREVRG